MRGADGRRVPWPPALLGRLAGKARVRRALDRGAGEEDEEQRSVRRERAHRDRPEGRRGVTEEVVDAQGHRAPARRDRARDAHLLEGQEGARLARADRDVAENRGEHDEPRITRRQEDHGRDGRERAERQQGRARAVPLCRAADEPRKGRASSESQRDRHTHARGVQAEVAQIDREDDPEKSVAEGPRGLRTEDGQDIRLTKGRHVLSITSGGGVPMNPVERVLYRELTELLDRLAASVPEGSLEQIRASSPTLRARLDEAEANLARVRSALLDGYGRWRRALEDVENLWALAGWRSTVAEEPAEKAGALAA